jgi:hypothetical protein
LLAALGSPLIKKIKEEFMFFERLGKNLKSLGRILKAWEKFEKLKNNLEQIE